MNGLKIHIQVIQLNENEFHSLHSLVQRGYNQKRSGDVIVSLQIAG